MTILAKVQIEGDTNDWFSGECEFPVLPPIGATIRIIDKNANLLKLTVKDIVIEGVMSKAKAEFPSLYAKQDITLFTIEN